MPVELVIVTPYGETFRDQVESVVLPGAEGEFGVLQNHERFLAPLAIGEAEIKRGTASSWAAMAGGFADVGPDQVTVLVESCEIADDIDLARAELAKERAESELARLRGEDDVQRFREYEAALERAINRITVARKAAHQ